MNFLGNTVVQILNASFVEGIVRNFETILPVQAIFLPLAAAITGEKADLSEPWLYLLFIHWLGSVLHSLWTFANPFHCLLYLVRIDSIHSQGDPSYDWLLHYWINHPSHARKRTFNTLSRSASAVNMNNPMPFIRGADGERGLLHTGERASKIAFAHPPRDNETVWFFRDGVLFRLSASSGFEKITVRCFAKSRQPLVAFLREARAFHRKTQTKKVPFHTYDHPGGTWETFTKPHRPLSTIKIPRSTKESLLQDVVGFLDDEKWYALRGIPWRRTYFLHGPVGSGKSSTIHALASELQLAIYALDLRLTGMDISTIGAAIRSVPARSLIQIEGIDALLADHQRNVIGIGHQRGGDGPQQEAMVSAVDMRCPFGAGSAHSETRRASESLGLTLPAFWRCIDDAHHTEGHIFVLTSNTFEDVDPADIEPIRCDLNVQFQKATRDLAKDLFLDFYSADMSLSGLYASDVGEALSELASQWIMHLEDDHFSMGALQRMLIQHKGKPERAVQVMPTWILAQRARMR